MRFILMLAFASTVSAETPAQYKARNATSVATSREVTVVTGELSAAQKRVAELEGKVAALERQLGAAKSEATGAKQTQTAADTSCKQDVSDLLAAIDARDATIAAQVAVIADLQKQVGVANGK